MRSIINEMHMRSVFVSHQITFGIQYIVHQLKTNRKCNKNKKPDRR